MTVFRVTGVDLTRQRVNADGKRRLLRAVASAREDVGFHAALRIVGISSTRHTEWQRRAHGCALDDQSSCPSAHPFKLLPKELMAMKGMLMDAALAHMSIRALSLYAQRTGQIFCHTSTWYKMVRTHGWRRVRTQLSGHKPKVGVRASAPNELWHVDVTVIRLLSGARVYLQAVIDNYSRKVLAWRVYDRIAALGTVEVLAEAEASLDASHFTAVAMDGGAENINGDVSALFDEHFFKRVLAQVDVMWSNARIECWWRSLKSGWLYTHRLESIEQVRRLVAFYVDQHNNVMSHPLFDGPTPSEVHDGAHEGIEDGLRELRMEARRRRYQENKTNLCDPCPTRLRKIGVNGFSK